MRDLFCKIREDGQEIIRQYLRYKTQVCKQTYDDLEGWEDERLEETEQAWPEYVNSTELMVSGEFREQYESDNNYGMEKVLPSPSKWTEFYKRRGQGVQEPRPIYESDNKKEKVLLSPSEWTELYKKQVQRVQELRQHHVHLPDSKGVRRPLTCCKRKDKPNECKGGFPLIDRLIEEPVIVCPGLAKKMGMSMHGRRNEVGSLYGPRNEPNLNGSHPCLLAATGFNSDVQVPYVFPIIDSTHSSLCDRSCVGTVEEHVIISAAQRAQDARVGYSCDYQNKRNPLCIHEVKEFQKGHRTLHEELKDEHRSYIGRRHAQRIISDFYGKGVVRGAVESVNLLTNNIGTDATAAETMKTARCVMFNGIDLLNAIDSYGVDGKKLSRSIRIAPAIDKTDKQRPSLFCKQFDIFYGYRGTNKSIHILSPYEFARYWEISRVRYPASTSEIERSKKLPYYYHADLTDSGFAKIEKRSIGEKDTLIPGIDYKVKSIYTESSSMWLPFPENSFTNHFRHSFIMARRRRPVVPSFEACPMLKTRQSEKERNAKILSAYFRPWVLNPDDASFDVVHVDELRDIDKSWDSSLKEWLNGCIPSIELARYITNFLGINRTRAPLRNESDSEGRSDDLLDDEPLDLKPCNLQDALITRIGGRPDETSKIDMDDNAEETQAAEISHASNSRTAIDQATSIWNIDRSSTWRKPIKFSRYKYRHIERYLKAARESKKDDPLYYRNKKIMMANVEVRRGVDKQVVEDWLHQARTDLNKEQMELVEITVTRVLKEEGIKTTRERQESRPELRLLHGGPGVGKSTVIKK